jgi:3-deoxy-manno-octulosonate cytidylyltransferase (CMP-KDO synthetase)
LVKRAHFATLQLGDSGLMLPIILIPSRLAATRLPNKPLADIAGKPMIVHVWERAVAANVGRVVVAADHADIAAAIHHAGGEVVMTDSELPSGSDRIAQALARLENNAQHDVIINVQGDLPTLDPAIVRDVLRPLQENAAVDISTLVARIEREEERTDPAVVKPILSWYAHDMARALYFTRATAPHGEGDLYHHIGLYAYRRTALERFVSLPPSPLELCEKLEQLRALEAGMRVDAVRVDTVPLGVDTPEHLQRAREMLGNAA